eukprot:jgi/Botrbrau1/21313/Bobra.0184s0024.1
MCAVLNLSGEVTRSEAGLGANPSTGAWHEIRLQSPRWWTTLVKAQRLQCFHWLSWQWAVATQVRHDGVPNTRVLLLLCL